MVFMVCRNMYYKKNKIQKMRMNIIQAFSYGPEKLAFKPGKWTNTLTAKKKDFTILPKELCDEHHNLRNKNH